MNLIHQHRAVAVAAALLFAAAGAQAGPLVVNGGFETGDLSGWTTTGPLDSVGADPFAAHSGNWGAFFGPETPVTLSQSLSTTTGATYEVSFWLSLQDSGQPNNFSWSWNGATQTPSFNNAMGFDYTEFTELVTAGGPSTTLSFSFTDPPSFWLLDDVSVSAVSSVPEPNTALMTGLGLMSLVLARRRRGSGQSS
jgi:hypothetical protein